MLDGATRRFALRSSRRRSERAKKRALVYLCVFAKTKAPLHAIYCAHAHAFDAGRRFHFHFIFQKKHKPRDNARRRRHFSFQRAEKKKKKKARCTCVHAVHFSKNLSHTHAHIHIHIHIRTRTRTRRIICTFCTLSLLLARSHFFLPHRARVPCVCAQCLHGRATRAVRARLRRALRPRPGLRTGVEGGLYRGCSGAG